MLSLPSLTLAQSDMPAPESRAKDFLKTNVVIPPSPEAASLGKYGNTPVSYYTGAPNISLPFYTVQGKSISLPLSMSYNATGNKVAEVPSWVGLGWTLSAGGVVSRSVIGKPDMAFNYYNKVDDIFTFRGPIEDPSYTTYEFFDNVKKGNIETQSDVYFFNVAGYSGKFYIVPTNSTTFKLVISDITDVKIEPIGVLGASDMGFRLITPTGIQYEFTTTETTRFELDDSENTTNRIFYYPSSWFLTKIISLDKKEEISFNYENTGTYSQSINSYQYESMNYTTNAYISNPPSNNTPPPVTSSFSPISSSVIQDRKYLSTISYKLNNVEKETVTFTKELRSESVCSGRALKEIKVQRDVNAVLKFNFEYYADSYLNRLALNSVKESGTFNSVYSEKPPHIFNYKNQVQFPAYTSTGIDHWGFYNGYSNGNGLIPSQTVDNTTYAGHGANREPDASGSLIGMISSIKYPTGGTTEYDFEPHLAQVPNSQVVRTIGGTRIKEIRDYSADNVLATRRQFEYKADDVTYGSCSGLLFTDPVYYSISSSYHYPDVLAPCSINNNDLNTSEYSSTTISLSTSSTSELGSVQGSHIGYSRVIEKTIGGGRTVYTFKNVAYTGGTGVEESNGNLLKKEDFDETGTLVAKTENFYNEDSRRAKGIFSYAIVPKGQQDNKTRLCEVKQSGGSNRSAGVLVKLTAIVQ